MAGAMSAGCLIIAGSVESLATFGSGETVRPLLEVPACPVPDHNKRQSEALRLTCFGLLISWLAGRKGCIASGEAPGTLQLN